MAEMYPKEDGTTSKSRPRYIAVEGVIGVGKTTLTRLLGDEYQAEQVYENYEQNPFLINGFYENRNAFNTEVFFLVSRFQQQKTTIRKLLTLSKKMVFSDYCFHKNIIFAQTTLTEEDLKIYKTVFNTFLCEIVPPDLIIYLTADIDTIMKRIYYRDRSFERKMSIGYVEKLAQAYEAFFSQHSNQFQVLRIDTSNLDVIRNQNDYLNIRNLVDRHIITRVNLQQNFSFMTPQASPPS